MAPVTTAATAAPAAKTSASRNDFAGVFAAIKPMFAKHAKHCIVLDDKPGKYALATRYVRAKDGYRLWLGSVEIKKSYVSAHVFPTYMYPELLDTISPELRKHMHGKACFNFKRPEAAIFRELDALITAGYEQMERSL
jgi:hypothetical protein